MNASKFFLKAANSLVTAIVALFLILAAAYSGYALWDNAGSMALWTTSSHSF